MKREAWFDLARDLDWEFSYVRQEEVFPEAMSGSPWLAQEEWQGWDEPYKTTYADYVANQSEKRARWAPFARRWGGSRTSSGCPAAG
jgi:toluene monooxygenase system protein A